MRGGKGRRRRCARACLTQCPPVEATHEGEHGIVGAAGGLEAEQTGSSQGHGHTAALLPPSALPVEAATVRHCAALVTHLKT